MVRRFFPVALVLMAPLLLLTSCSSSSAPSHETPVQTAQHWFTDINNKNESAVLAAFVPNANGYKPGWENGTWGWSTYSDVRCTPTDLSVSASRPTVHCTFKESPSRDEGNLDTFWNIGLQRQSNGTWLIYEYGQG
jgi:hypothetical protein